MPQNAGGGMPKSALPDGNAFPLQLDEDGNLLVSFDDDQFALISGGSITKPVAYLDIELPEGYASFQLLLQSFKLTYLADFGDTWLAYALSADSGKTFINNALNNDSYSALFNISYGLNPDDGFSQYNGFQANSDSLAVLGFYPPPNADQTYDLLISPGGDGLFAQVQENGAVFCLPVPSIEPFAASRSLNVTGINPTAAITPTSQRMNLMRLLPYGNGDCNPPTSGLTIVAGDWVLYGVKA